jgi:hypothetical protein
LAAAVLPLCTEFAGVVKTAMTTIVAIVTKKMLQVEKMRGRWDIIEFSSGGLSASTPMLSFKRLSLET